MKKVVFFVGIAVLFLWANSTFAQQGIGTLQPDKSAALEVVSTKRGILIPRVDIPDLSQAAPIQNPAHSLLIFNTGNSGTEEGFYYWNDDGTQLGVGSWIPFGSLDETEIIAGDHIHITTTQQNNSTTYEIGLEAGNIEGQLLVTSIDNSDPQNPVATAQWVDTFEIIKELQEGTNAITLESEMDSNNMPTGKILLKLGGVLTQPTEIRTGWDEINNQLDSNNTLAITGLSESNEMNKLLVVTSTPMSEGVVRTLKRSISQTITSSGQIELINDYSNYIPEINLDIDVANLNSDINLTLPDPLLSEGQTITILITDSNALGEPNAYVNIYENDGNTLLTYGSLPFQSWILRSNGNLWLLSGRF